LTLITKNKINISEEGTDIIQDIRLEMDHAALQMTFDSLVLDYPLVNANDKDSLKQKLLGRPIDITNDSISDFNIKIGEINFGNTFASADLIQLGSDEFTAKYGKDSFWDKVVVRQVYRFLHDLNGVIQFLIGNFLWVVVLLALFTALFLKLLYIRREYFLVDHLILSLFIHSFLLLTFSLYYLLEFYIFNGDGNNSVFGAVALVAVPLYAYLSMKRYYKQGWFKTFLKFILLSFYQLLIVGIFMVFVVAISLLIY
jgi:hypothetical protein